MAKLGEELWKKIETPQGRAFVSDSCIFMSDEEVIERAKNALAWEREAVKVLREFLKAHPTRRALDLRQKRASKGVIDRGASQ
jgi:hypothetical protein